MLNTILFDLDGTLCPYDQNRFIKTYLETLDQCLTPMGYDGKRLVEVMWKSTGAMLQNDGSRTNRQAFWEGFTRELGIGALPLESILDDFYLREFDSVRCVMEERVDRGPLIRGLRKKGYGVILATNPVFPAVAVATRLSWVGLRSEDFDFATTYENSRHSKPNVEYYRDIMAKAGKRPEECMMIGNSPSDDMAAMRTGMGGRLVTDYLENAAGLPTDGYTCLTFRELEAYLECLPPVDTGR